MALCNLDTESPGDLAALCPSRLTPTQAPLSLSLPRTGQTCSGTQALHFLVLVLEHSCPMSALGWTLSSSGRPCQTAPMAVPVLPRTGHYCRSSPCHYWWFSCFWVLPSWSGSFPEGENTLRPGQSSPVPVPAGAAGTVRGRNVPERGWAPCERALQTPCPDTQQAGALFHFLTETAGVCVTW